MVLLHSSCMGGCRGQFSWREQPSERGFVCDFVGSILYAASNVSEEFVVKSADRVEVMAMLGFFGAIVSAIQISILERNELKSIHWSAEAALPFVGFSAALFIFYSLAPVLLKLSGSAMLNLSLLTSDMWAVLIRIFAYHQKVDWMYFMAFAAVVVGLIIYSGGDKGDEQHYAEIADEDAERSRYFDEKAGLLGNSNQSSIVGGSRIGDSSKHGSASSGIARQDDTDNKRMEKDAQWKTG